MDSMENHAWFRFFPGDWESKTSHLFNDEVGAYLRLILCYYKIGALPPDPLRLQQIARVKEQDWLRTWGAIKGYFQEGADGLTHHNRCDEEIAWRDSQAVKRHAQTEAALKARGIDVERNVGRNIERNMERDVERNVSTDIAMLHRTEPEPEPEPEPKPKQQPEKEPSGFLDFWSAYPRREGKADARKAFVKATGKAPLQVLLDAIKWQSRQEAWTKDGGKFIPHPATWLNGERWLDEKPKPTGPPLAWGVAPPGTKAF